MDATRCQRQGCTGTIEDGYCNVCGYAAINSTSPNGATTANTGRSSSVTTGTGSSPLTNRSKGSRRTATSTKTSSRKQLGAGLISLPELPSTEPEKAILVEAKVPENKRFCANCNNPLKREQGFCSKCGQKYSFVATLKPGDLVVGQYEVKGAIAFGGLGWIYLGFDRTLSRYVVLKGLLNTEDASSAAVAVAERQFLATVKHANIVGIYNFVNHGSEGFIVMEYIGGKTLKEIRKARGPLPIPETIAYIHRILSAFAYLHSLELVYCDFKPDNIMLEGNDVKLIDMGGVRRIDDLAGDIYGTVGYTAPEAGEGPTIVSDLFTIGRTLMVLVADIKGFTSEYLYTLPSAQEIPVFAEQESFYRFLLKATATNPDDRFQSADEMADQLIGVLREVVSMETKTPHPATSTIFSGDRLAMVVSGDFEPIKADHHQLPVPLLDATDPGFKAIVNAGEITDPLKRVFVLTQIVDKFPDSTEALLRLANSMIESNNYEGATKILKKVEENNAWDWRVFWYRGRMLMAQNQYKEAQAAFDQVYFDLPGELAPKLALALAAERAGNLNLATSMYNLVSTTDSSYSAAIFGLARVNNAKGDRQGAVEALKRTGQSSSLFTRAQIEIARTLINQEHSKPAVQELQLASSAIETITLEGMERYRLTQQVLETTLNLLTSKAINTNSGLTILGETLEEKKLRQGLEKTYRAMAHLATGEEKIRLVDEANKIRPRSLF